MSEAGDGMAAARELARQGDWPALWELVPHLRADDAVRAVRLVPDAWRPPDAAGRRLFGQLAIVNPDVFESLAEPVRRIRYAPVVFGPSVNAGRREIAVWETGLAPTRIRVFDLATGRAVRRWRARHTVGPLLPLGDAVITIELTRLEWEIVRYGWPRSREVLLADKRPPKIALVHDTFLAIGDGRLWRGEEHGPLRELALPPDVRNPHQVAADAASGRMALTFADPADWRTRIVVLDDELMVIGRSQADEYAHLRRPLDLAFCGSDTLISLGEWGKLRSWRVDGTVAVQGRADFSYDPASMDSASEPYGPTRPRLWVTPVPSLGQVVVGGGPEVTGDYSVSTGVVLDARALTPVSRPPWLRGDRTWRQAAADGDYIAWWGVLGRMDVFDVRLSALHRLASGPMSEAGPADIDLLETTDGRFLSPAAKTAVSLLLALLRYRLEL